MIRRCRNIPVFVQFQNEVKLFNIGVKGILKNNGGQGAQEVSTQKNTNKAFNIFL